MTNESTPGDEKPTNNSAGLVCVEDFNGHVAFIQPAIAPDVECGTMILYGIFDPRAEEEE